MHRTLKPLLCCLFSTVLLNFVCLAAESSGLPNNRAGRDAPAAKPTAEKKADVTVTVDPRVELIAITQHLSGYTNNPRFKGRISDLDYPYINTIKQHFAEFKDHASIKRLAELRVSGSDPMFIAVQMSEPDEVAFRNPVDRSGVRTENAEAYVDALRAFAKAANFKAFFDENKASYDTLISNFNRSLDTQSIVTQTQNYCGEQPGRYVIVLAPLLGRASFGPNATAPDKSKVFYAILPAYRVVDGSLSFGESSLIGDYLYHEFGHSFINPLVDKHWSELEKYASLMEKVRYRQSANYGRDWKICLYESVVRAMTARIILRQKGAQAYADQLASDKKSGFFFIEDLCRSLETYEQSRDKFQNLESYFPELIQVIARLPQKSADDTTQATQKATP